MHCSPARQSPAIVRGLYLISFTVIPETARRKSTPCPTPVRLMTTPLSFRIDDTPIPPPTVPAAVAATYGRRSSRAIYCGLGATVLQPPGHCWT
jgi:hypothetical protein